MTDEIDADKIDDAVLALLYLGVHGDSFLPETMARAWKGFDWEAMNRLCKKGLYQRPGEHSGKAQRHPPSLRFQPSKLPAKTEGV